MNLFVRFFSIVFHPVMLCLWSLAGGILIMSQAALERRMLLLRIAGLHKLRQPGYQYTVFPAVSRGYPRAVPRIEEPDAVFNEPEARKWLNPAAYDASVRHFSTRVKGHWSSITNSVAAKVRVRFDRPFYRRNHLIRFSLEGAAPGETWYAVSSFQGKIIQGAGGDQVFPLQVQGGLQSGTVNTGFGTKPGLYRLVVIKAAPGPLVYRISEFEIRARRLPPAGKPLGVVTLETAIPLRNQRIPGPAGEPGGYRNLFAWNKFMGGDAMWVLGAHSDGIDPRLSPDSPLGAVSLQNAALLAAEAEKRGVPFGVYVVSYFTPRKGGLKAGYAPSMGYDEKKDRFYISRHTSLGSARRFYDLVRFAEKMQQLTGVGYIGFDFIRTGHRDGFELVDRFVAAMNIRVPDGWASMLKRTRMRWFARQILVSGNYRLLDKWRWWRAHFVSSLVGDVIKTAGVSKPVWAFTLGWEHGRQHGQDPYMMFDAGCAYTAAMLYEANSLQFDGMELQWHKYLNSRDSRVLMGNCVDRVLNRSAAETPLEAFYDRMVRGYFNFVHNGPAAGMFWHDLGRAIWGRTGVFSGQEWALAGGSAFTVMRVAAKSEPLLVKDIRIQYTGGSLINVSCTLTNTAAITLRGEAAAVNHRLAVNSGVSQRFAVKGGASRTLRFVLRRRAGVSGKFLLGLCLKRDGYGPAWFSRFVRLSSRSSGVSSNQTAPGADGSRTGTNSAAKQLPEKH